MARTKAFDELTVLERAMDVFWRKGYHGTSIQDLVSELGVNRASLYSTYGGKEELFLRTLKHYRETNTAIVAKFLAAQDSGKRALELLFRRAVAETVNEPSGKGCFVVNVTTELARENAQVRSYLVLNETTFVALFQQVLAKAQADGELGIDRDLNALANLLYTLYSGIKVISKLHDGPGQLEAVVTEAMRLLD